MSSILIIDDDKELCELVSDYLEPEGYTVTCVHRGEEGVDVALSGKHSFLILDIMLPGLGGFEILRRIRAASSSLPVLMLTARGSDLDRILGLEIGADDYLPKPFNPQELVARIRAIQRRTNPLAIPDTKPREVLNVDDLSIDIQARRVDVKGREVDLTSVEFCLLEEMLRAAGQVVSREKLSKSALGRKLQPYDRALDMHVSNLRKKLTSAGKSGDPIQTVRGTGYIYTLPPVGGA